MSKCELNIKAVARPSLLVTSIFTMLLSIGSTLGSAYYSLSFQPGTTVASPGVILQSGTAGNSLIYANSTSARVSAVAPAPTPTYYPNGYNVVAGTYFSGTVPASVQTLDTDYFTVRSFGTATSTTVYNPSNYSLIGSTTLVSGTAADLASDNGVYMTFRSYFSETTTFYSPSGYNLLGYTTLASGTVSNLFSNDNTSMTFQSYPNADDFIGYRSNTGTNLLSSPKSRTWNGTTWSTESELPSAGSPIRWIRVAYNPQSSRYYEKVAVTLSDDGYLDAYVWTGSAWSTTNNIGFVGTTANAYRPFDIIYETTSGNAMLVYGISSPSVTQDLAYNIWNGTAWTAQSYIDDATESKDIQYSWVDLAAKRTSGSNEISLIGADDSDSDANCWIWNGATWGYQMELSNSIAYTSSEAIGVTYETNSGRAMFVVARPGRTVDYRRWLGASWEGTGPSSYVLDNVNKIKWIGIKANPVSTSNELIVYSISDAGGLSTGNWNGTAWNTAINHDTAVDASTGTTRCADFDWEPSGSRGLLVWGTTAGQIAYKTFTSPNSWGTQQNLAMGANIHPWVQLRRNPRNSAEDTRILGAVLEATVFDLGAIKWNGSSLTIVGTSTLTVDTTVTTYECFRIAFQVVPGQFTSEVELTGSSNTSIWSQLVWTVDSAWNVENITVTIQLYNWSQPGYPTSGDGYLSYTSSATPNMDETKTQTISINPQNYRDANGNWKIKIKGVKPTTTQFDFKADWVEYRPTGVEYTSEIEFTGSSNTETWAELAWSIDSAWTVGSVEVTIQVYNYTQGQYPSTPGNGYDRYTSNSTADWDQTRTQTITTNSQHFRNATGHWKIRIKGVKSTTTQFDFKADWIEFKPSHYTEYTVSTEFLFSSMTPNTPTQLNFTVVAQYNVSSVNTTIQVWNYSSSSYVTSGDGYATYVSAGSGNETTYLTINTNSQFYTSAGNTKIKIAGTLSTTAQYQQDFNQVKLVYSYSSSPNYNYVLKIANQDSSAWKIRLKAYSNSSVARLNNCTIYFGSFSDGTSRQIYIQNGTYVNQTGPWYDLPPSTAETYISLTLDASNSQVSYVYVYLETLIPNSSTYARYILTFEIT